MKVKSRPLVVFIIGCLLMISLTGCVAFIGVGVFNNVTEIKKDSALFPDNDSAVILVGAKVEGTDQKLTFGVDRFIPGKRKLEASCFFYTYSSAIVYPQGAAMQYYAFNVPPGYYKYNDTKGTSERAFKVEARKVNYLGDFILTSPGTYPGSMPPWPITHAERREDLTAAEAAVKQFRSLKWPVVEAPQAPIEGQMEPHPFCTM